MTHPLGGLVVRLLERRRAILQTTGAVAIWLMPTLAMASTDNAALRSLMAVNFSRLTMCAEEDNVSVPLFAPADLGTFEITAIHPQYDFFNDNCTPNFANCSIDSPGDFTFTPGDLKLFDDGRTVVQGVRVERWFLPNTMAASVAGGPAFDSHFVRFIRRIGATDLFPEVMVINMDGNIRLKPQAPVGKPNNDTCFGSSVLVGPANPSAERPVAEIMSLSYNPTADRFDIAYRDGSTATLVVQTVDRSQATIRVGIGYPVSGAMPAAIFRSMFVADGNSDVDRIRSDSGTVGILNFIEDTGRSFTFFRAVHSVHNTSAPDIQIEVQSPSNQPPVVTNPGNQTGVVGANVNLAISASDPDGDTLSYSATGLPAGLSINPSTGVITGTLTTAGTSSVTVTVSDGQGGTAPVSFIWTVTMTFVGPAPQCSGRTANVFVRDGFIVGGPNNGQQYTGRLRGTARADVMVGTPGNDILVGSRGNDRICGRGGNDDLRGGAGNDRLFGQAGRDRLSGGTGSDRCSGGAGRDTFSSCERILKR